MSDDNDGVFVYTKGEDRKLKFKLVEVDSCGKKSPFVLSSPDEIRALIASEADSDVPIIFLLTLSEVETTNEGAGEGNVILDDVKGLLLAEGEFQKWEIEVTQGGEKKVFLQDGGLTVRPRLFPGA